jgi:uncharacterized coiled-coil protein SlyX/ribosomal protein L35
MLHMNAALEARNGKLLEQIADLETVIQRLWERGRQAAPSPRGLRAWATGKQEEARRERQEAEEARLVASQSLHTAMQAHTDVSVTMRQLQQANHALEAEKSAAREWHATDATDLSRRMADLSHQLTQERHRNEAMQRQVEYTEALRSSDVGRLLGEMQRLRDAHAAESATQLEESSRQAALVEEAREQMASLQAAGAMEASALQEEVGRQEALVSHARQSAANSSLTLNRQLTLMSERIRKLELENETLLSEAEGARAELAGLGAHARETEARLTSETMRLSAVVERLGGEAVESRTELMARLEQVSTEREATVSDLSRRLEFSEAERQKTTTQLRETVDKMRWLQSKAISDGGSLKPGPHRQALYWERCAEGFLPAHGSRTRLKAEGIRSTYTASPALHPHPTFPTPI